MYVPGLLLRRRRPPAVSWIHLDCPANVICLVPILRSLVHIQRHKRWQLVTSKCARSSTPTRVVCQRWAGKIVLYAVCARRVYAVLIIAACRGCRVSCEGRVSSEPIGNVVFQSSRKLTSYISIF